MILNFIRHRLKKDKKPLQVLIEGWLKQQKKGIRDIIYQVSSRGRRQTSAVVDLFFYE